MDFGESLIEASRLDAACASILFRCCLDVVSNDALKSSAVNGHCSPLSGRLRMYFEFVQSRDNFSFAAEFIESELPRPCVRPSFKVPTFDEKCMQKHTEETSGDSSPRRCKSGKCACACRGGFSRNPLRKSWRPRTFVNGLGHVDASEFATTSPRKNYLKFSGSVVVFSGVATVLVVFAASLEESAPFGIGVKKTSTRRFSWLPRAPLVAMGRNSP